DIIYRTAHTGEEFDQARCLFKEYAEALGVDLSFQGFEKELETIHIQYNKPDGGLLLVYKDGNPVACAAVRSLDDETSELKRMYVKSEFRGFRIGVELLQRSLSLAKVLGYKKIRLDTLGDMVKAQELYKSFGFYTIPPYRFNPISGTIFMEKIL
ncbi:MAG TPA: GNAT family N-acetyltransferase, partial [Puia sp.]|nr:GNAT family N-acetyltransferase [Puia sp.]